jgi:hypothetical protein
MHHYWPPLSPYLPLLLELLDVEVPLELPLCCELWLLWLEVVALGSGSHRTSANSTGCRDAGMSRVTVTRTEINPGSSVSSVSIL